MKKCTSKIFSGISIALFVFAFYYLTGHFSENEGLNTYSSEELWQMQYQKKKEKRKVGYSKLDKPNKFAEYFQDITTEIGSNESAYKMNYKVREYNKAKAKQLPYKSTKSKLEFVSRGPANVAGRTRALVVDPDDTSDQTWFVGSVSGGIWKTEDGGANWVNLSDKLTNLSVCAMAMSASNHDIMYAGTGESMPAVRYMVGNGVWKTVDRGENWSQLMSTATSSDFAYINRIIIHPSNPDIVLAATETGIFKSTDGGNTWEKVYVSYNGVEDLVEHPTNFNMLYAGENSTGILRSLDAGETWSIVTNGMVIGGRFELAVSKVNPNHVFSSVNISTNESHVYMSADGGNNWVRYNDDKNFLGGQGDYDNIIEADPFNENQVFVGGVDIWKVNFSGNIKESSSLHMGVFAENANFLDFVNFGGAFKGGGIDTSDNISRVQSDWVSVELRFGPGISQKAHRFTVPDGSTSGLSRFSYTYTDYIDVPFQVWDVTNNRQLMVSFRDQEGDGSFNLYEATGSAFGTQGREYIYINAVEYDANSPNTIIARTGGHWYKALYMIWPDLRAGETWDANNLPESKVHLKYGTIQMQSGVKTCIADSYGNNGGGNNYDQGAGFGTTKIPGLHPDHHNFIFIPKSNSTFTFIDANDGGIGISYNNGADFEMLPNNNITTQFYGVAKNPIANEYFGGMQDNGSWQSAGGENATDKSKYIFRLGGDGFECLWHADDPNLILGSIYNNSIRKSTDGGKHWGDGSNGIVEDDGPFITRLSASKENPDLVFALGKSGVYRSDNFGKSWETIEISENWILNDNISSAHHVEVSLANGKIVWAGAGIARLNELSMFVSTNAGKSFKAVSDFKNPVMPYYISGMATHPTQQQTAYVLYSVAEKPKILRTTNLGESWEDISGFGTNTSSSNGYPDVITNCLLVMPYNTEIIWAGTDIGLFESTDNGQTWHVGDYNLPPVSIFDMHIVGNQVVIATHGRGIWSVDIPEIDNVPCVKLVRESTNELKVTTEFKITFDRVEFYVNNELNKLVSSSVTGINDYALNVSYADGYSVYVLGYVDNVAYKSNTYQLHEFTINAKQKLAQPTFVYPNPNYGQFKVKMSGYTSHVDVYSLNGKLVYSQRFTNETEASINIGNDKPGTYIVRVYSEEGVKVAKILVDK